MKKAEKVVREFAERFPGIKGAEANDDGSIHLGNIAEGGTVEITETLPDHTEMSFDFPAADFYMEFGINSETDNPGIHQTIIDFLKERGYFMEWVNAGMITAYVNFG